MIEGSCCDSAGSTAGSGSGALAGWFGVAPPRPSSWPRISVSAFPPAPPRGPGDQRTEQVPVLAARDLLRQVRQHDRRQDRQQPLHQVALTSGLAAAERAAKGLSHLVSMRAEDVADDLLAVGGVDLAQIHTAVQQVTGVITEGTGQGCGAGRVFGVGLEAPEEGRYRLPGGRFGRRLVDAQLRSELGHRQVGEDLFDCAQRRAFLRAAG